MFEMIDFIVVITGWLSFFIGGDNISAIRTLRILRPLRTISFFKGMRILVRSILTSVPKIVDVLYFWLFLLLVFGLMGV